MTLLLLLSLGALGVFLIVMVGAMLIGYISESRTGAGYVLLGALLAAVIFGALLRVG